MRASSGVNELNHECARTWTTITGVFKNISYAQGNKSIAISVW